MTKSFEDSGYPKRIPAPLGLSEWECSDGSVYYDSKMAQAHENGIKQSLAEHFGGEK